MYIYIHNHIHCYQLVKMTTVVVIAKSIVGQVKGKPEMKYKYKLSVDGTELYALHWNSLPYPIVYDGKFEQYMQTDNWSCPKGLYAYNANVGRYMHQYVLQLSNQMCCEGQSVDHINGYKTDNRVVNLRVASQSEQNSNRDTRRDKIPPLPELLEAGVTEYPRHVRWDKSESKFVIEKHPVLCQEVRDGKRKKAVMSGSKSSSITVMDKYKDILARLRDLDDQVDDGFREIRLTRRQEFEAIVQAIKTFNGVVVPQKEDFVDVPEGLSIAPVKRTHAGRKKPSALPEGCGVTVDMIPKYCWYRAESDTRGDAFLISRHPKLCDKGWSTTSSKAVPTLEKYNMLMEKLNELDH